ncbi:MAG: hypothetical protein U0491_01155 [Candidatus Saccharimonadales bacterium]
MSTDNDMYRYALQLVEAKGTADGPFKEQLAKELQSMIEETIQLELLQRMNKQQMDEFNTLLTNNSTTDDAIVDFIRLCDIDIDAVNAVALTKVRVAYLGA